MADSNRSNDLLQEVERPIAPSIEEREEESREPSVGQRFARPLCEVLVGLLEANGSKAPETISKRWLDDARLLVDRDHRDPHEAKAVLEWALADSFWRANILSLPKFRDRYDQLRLQRERALGSVPVHLAEIGAEEWMLR